MRPIMALTSWLIDPIRRILPPIECSTSAHGGVAGADVSGVFVMGIVVEMSRV